jgi:CRISPR-associated protein Cmr3
MTPAGAVYFLRVEGDESARRAFARRIWLQAISDEEQDRRDGFGIALLGTWDGKTETLEVKHE